MRILDQLQQAFQEWADTLPQEIIIPAHTRVVHAGYRTLENGPTYIQGGIYPVKAHWDGRCCPGDHYTVELGSHKPIPKPDDHVCERERRWRKYTRIRDGQQTKVVGN